MSCSPLEPPPGSCDHVGMKTRPLRTQSPVDELLDRYLSWREECAALAGAFERWRTAPPDERNDAFAAYRAQLDLEEHAAKLYQLSTAAVQDAIALQDVPIAA